MSNLRSQLPSQSSDDIIRSKKRIANDDTDDDNDDDDDDNDDDDADNGNVENEGGDVDNEGDDDDENEGNVADIVPKTSALNLVQQYAAESNGVEIDTCIKFNQDINSSYIQNIHPECTIHNYDEVLKMTKVTRDENNIIIDDLHRTFPFITKYEKTKIIGQRAKQINSGAIIFVKIPDSDIPLDGYNIALLEFEQKCIPFIIKRPLPNGGCEYWNISDFEIIT